MISAATGAMALVMVTLVKNHGLQYLFATTILTGILQLLAGFLKFGSLMSFVSKSVVTGFVNSLAILIFMAQLPEFRNVGFEFYAMVALGLGIIYILPRFVKALPSPLVCIIVLTIISVLFKFNLRTVGDMGDLPSSLPIFLMPNIPFSLETLLIILPYALSLTAVGLLESLMTATIVDDLTNTTSDKNKECRGQGIANILSGFIGGMAGCGMIGQTIINVKAGARTRLSTFCAGAFLLFFILVMGKWVRQIPMAALVSVMIMVSIGTFNWSSLKNIRTHSKSSSFIMMTTVSAVILTHNLAIGVFIGIMLSCLFFSLKAAKVLTVSSALSNDSQTRTYAISGHVFFASKEKFVELFNYKESVKNIALDMSDAHFWDACAADAVSIVLSRFKNEGTRVELKGINKSSKQAFNKVDHLTRESLVNAS
ncbi:MAG: Bicarbonate transporter BicA [Chlamydiae bacterium]|nr:Bicarbonate transporter BicA [Chlamydiota bacterium]